MGIQREDGGVWRGSALYRRDLRIWGLWLEERSGVLRGLDICGEDTNEYIGRISEKKNRGLWVTARLTAGPSGPGGPSTNIPCGVKV